MKKKYVYMFALLTCFLSFTRHSLIFIREHQTPHKIEPEHSQRQKTVLKSHFQGKTTIMTEQQTKYLLLC